MKRQFPGQFQDEDVLLTFRRHPIVMRKGLLIMMFALLAGAIVGLFTSKNALTMGDFLVQFLRPIGIGLLIGAIGFFYYWIGWYYSICLVTSQRFMQIRQKGIFKSRSVNDISLRRILSVNYEVRGMLETLLGFGTIIIQTLVGDFVISKVPHPAETQAEIVAAIKESGVELDEKAEADAQ
ncbi:MAG: PH domain-containing protein [Candidatus Saccharimonadales bacterium]